MPLRKGKKAPDVNAAFIRDLYAKAAAFVSAETHEYWLNHAALQGEQWVWYNPVTNRLDQLPRDPERVQVTINRLAPNTRTIMGKLTSRELRFDVMPTQADDATIRGAKIAEALLMDLKREHDWEGKREDSLRATWKGGHSAVAVDWDASAGTPVTDPDEVDDDTDRVVATGDTVETVLAAPDFVIEPGVVDAERARYWIKVQALPPQDVQGRYNLPDAPAADASAGMSPFQQKILNAHLNRDSDKADLTLVLTYYERPNPLRPEGAIAVVVGDKVVEGPKPWYFPFRDHLNFALIRETRQEHRWTGTTVLSDARPVQVAFNASWSSIIEHLKLAGNARLKMPQSAVDLIDTLTDTAGEILAYPDGTAPPEWLTPPQMPAWWIEQPEKLKVEMDDIMGVHDTSRGDAPSNIESGYGLSILAENDATPLGRLVKEHAIAWGKVASMVLRLYVKYATEPRTARVLVPGQAPESTKFTGKDLAGQVDAEVPVDAVLPHSRAAMQAFAEKALQMGLIRNVAQFVRLAEFPGQDDLITAVAPDVSRARRENHQMALGKAAIVEPFDDDEIHLQELTDFQKSVRYEMLDEETKNLFALHAQAHETQAAEKAGRTVAEGQVSTGLAATPNADGSPALPGEAAAALPEGTNPAVDLPAMPGGPVPGTQDQTVPDLFPNTFFDPGNVPPLS